MSLNHQNEISNKDTSQNPVWEFNSDSLNNWLENDLKQYNATHHHSNSLTSSKCSIKNIISEENKTPLLSHIGIKDSLLPNQKINNNTQQKTVLPNTTNNLIPIIKVYSLLNSIRQNEQMAKDKHHNKKRLYSSPLPPSPPILNIPIMPPKRKRGNNRTPVDINIKRQRNTDAARRSRLRKTIKMETLEKRVDTLRTENDRLRVKVAVLETEVTHAAEKEQRNKQRVIELEAQLAVVHKQLVDDYKSEN